MTLLVSVVCRKIRIQVDFFVCSGHESCVHNDLDAKFTNTNSNTEHFITPAFGGVDENTFHNHLYIVILINTLFLYCMFELHRIILGT